MTIESDRVICQESAVVDVTWGGARVGAQDATERAKALNKLRLGDVVFHAVTRGAALLVLLLLGGVMVALMIGSLPAHWRRSTAR
jgi:phosphate transport system permease protein